MTKLVGVRGFETLTLQFVAIRCNAEQEKSASYVAGGCRGLQRRGQIGEPNR